MYLMVYSKQNENHYILSQSYVHIITKHSSALYIGIAKVLPIIDVLGYDGQNSLFSSSPSSSSSPSYTQKGSHISTRNFVSM